MKFTICNSIKTALLMVFVIFMMDISLNAQDDIYKLDTKKEVSIVGTSLGLLGTSLVLYKARDPITEFDINNLDRSDIWGFDRSATSNYSNSAKIASDMFRDGIYFVPMTLLFSEKARTESKQILVMYTEVLALNTGLTSITKESVRRIRPFAYNDDVPLHAKLSSKTKRSFYSGHVSHVTSLSFFTASVFSDLFPSSKFKYLVWASAVTAPAITGYLRYKAGKHFPSDVIVGYGAGALIGYLIPKLHKTNTATNLSIVNSNEGIGLIYRFK